MLITKSLKRIFFLYEITIPKKTKKQKITVFTFKSSGRKKLINKAINDNTNDPYITIK